MQFTLIDWAVLIAYLAFTTWLGARLAGKQSSIREFFLAGRKMRWPAVAGSIIATEISGVTLVAVPALVFARGGDLTYLMFGIGALLARLAVAIWFVPAFYEREIYSPYDYVGRWIGPGALRTTTLLFLLSGVLGQSVRVLLTADILYLITGIPVGGSIWIIGAFALLWTIMGGMTTVIWTDVIQFFVFLAAMVAAVVFVVHSLPGGFAELWQTAAAAGKLRFWNFDPSPSATLTLWTSLGGGLLLGVAAYGTDQLMAQRMFCCRGPREASYAMVASSAGHVLAALACVVGLGLYAFYQRPEHALDAIAAKRLSEDSNYIFPIFVLTRMPVGLTGLIIAGIFAAAISSLESALAALSQTVVTGFYRPWRTSRGLPSEERQEMRASRLLVVFWALVLSAMAELMRLALHRYEGFIHLALSMATYAGGALLAAFLMALWRWRVDARGLAYGSVLSVLSVFGVTWHDPWAQWTVVIGVAAVVLTCLLHARTLPRAGRRSLAVLPLAAIPLALCFVTIGAADTRDHIRLAWPWSVPLGFLTALLATRVLSQRCAHPVPQATENQPAGVRPEAATRPATAANAR